jgi:GT2 family glycosyltransferase
MKAQSAASPKDAMSPASPASLADMTVVIPTIGREMLIDCLQSISNGHARPADLIVVDQGRNAELEAYIRRHDWQGLVVTYVPSNKRGRAAALNCGLKLVRTPYFAFTDDDCLVDPGWITAMHDLLVENPGSVITGRVMPEGDGRPVATVTAMEPATYCRPSLILDPLAGGNMGASMATIERVGFFDEDALLRTAEDCEWSYRVLSAGISIIYSPDVVMKHLSWRNSAGQIEQYDRYARSHGAFYGKYLRRGDLFIALKVVIHLIRALKRWLLGLVIGDEDRARNGRAYCMQLLPGIVDAVRGDVRN